MSALSKSIKIAAYRMVYWQIAIIIVLALVLFSLHGFQQAISVLLGGFAYCIPNFLFVRRVFAHASIRFIKQFVFAFYIGEALKLLVSAVTFVLEVKYLPVQFGYAMSGYVAAIMAFWIVSFLYLYRSQG